MYLETSQLICTASFDTLVLQENRTWQPVVANQEGSSRIQEITEVTANMGKLKCKSGRRVI